LPSLNLTIEVGTHEGIYTFLEISKNKVLAFLCDDIKSVMDVIGAKIENEKFELIEDKDKYILKILFDMDSLLKHVSIHLAKIPLSDMNEVIDDISGVIGQLVKRVKELESPTTNFYNESTIVKNEEIDIVKRWIHCNPYNVEFNLLYKSSRDGDLPADFHERCDGMGPTITFVEAGTSFRFGGFTNLNWGSSLPLAITKDNDAFVFSLNRKKKNKKYF